jgi:ABC-type transport system substrate-binding protein
MGPYLAARIAAILGTFLIVSLFVFAVMHAIPGGPFDEEKMPLPAESKANILRSYGLDRPLWEQYVYYLWNIAHLKVGDPWSTSPATAVSAGPFKLEKWERDRELVFVANRAYRGIRKPYLERIVYKIGRDETLFPGYLGGGTRRSRSSGSPGSRARF